jgi:TPR repeat protein
MFSYNNLLGIMIQDSDWKKFEDLLGFPLDPQNQYKNAQLVCFLKGLVEKNHPNAMVRLALWYQSGRRGLPENKLYAAKLFERAAILGSSDAMYELSLCYEMGLGVVEDEQKAMHWCEKAMEAGHLFACRS